MLVLVFREQSEALGMALVDDPNDAHSLRLMTRMILWFVGLVLLAGVWSDIGCAYLAADDRPRAIRAMRRAAARVFRRPFSSVAIVLWIFCGTVGVAVFSFTTQLTNEPYAPASPTVALTLLNAGLLAFVRLGAFGAATKLAGSPAEPTP